MGIARLSNKGFTIVELMVGLFLTSVIMIGLIQAFSMITSQGNDQKIRLNARLQAEAILNEIGHSIRATGNGIPFGQENFEIGEPNLSDPSVTYPVLLTESDANNLSLRLNLSGDTYILRADYTSLTSLSIQLVESEGLRVFQDVYVSNSLENGQDGAYATISSLNDGNNEIIISSPAVASPGAVFDRGSMLEPVTTIRYETLAGDIVREESITSVTPPPSGYTPSQAVLARNGELSFAYLDKNGAEITLPSTVELLENELVNTIRSIEVTVSVTSLTNTSNGAPYTAVVAQVFSMKNLNYVY